MLTGRMQRSTWCLSGTDTGWLHTAPLTKRPASTFAVLAVNSEAHGTALLHHQAHSMLAVAACHLCMPPHPKEGRFRVRGHTLMCFITDSDAAHPPGVSCADTSVAPSAGTFRSCCTVRM